MPSKISIMLGRDGLPMDDVSHFAPTPDELRSYEFASEELSRFKVPQLLDSADPHSYLLVGLMDGTGNDVEKDPLPATNVAKFREQIRALSKTEVGARVGFEYIEGAGTQGNHFERLVDGATGRTSLERASQLYESLAARADQIYLADPHAKIAMHLEGFSRGGSQVPLLARMIDEGGIPDRRSRVIDVDENGRTQERYTRFHQAPGETPMSVGLYDPVPTGYMELFDRRLPSSVVSGFQISSAHERRGLFPVDRIMPEGLSQDGRFLNMTVAGAHSDMAASYLRNGLGIRSLNLMTDYHNHLLGGPVIERLHEPTDPRMNVIHRSEEGNLLFRTATKVDRASPEGQIRELTADASRYARPGEVVHAPATLPEALRPDLRPMVAAATPVQRTSRVSEPSLTEGDTLQVRLTNTGLVELTPYKPPVLERPSVRMAGALGAAGVIAAAYEAKETGERIGTALAQDNPTGAESEAARYAAPGLGGAAAVLTPAAAGIGGGPAVALAVADAYLLTQAFDRGAQYLDVRKITHQNDRDGVQWQYTGRQWLRDDLKADLRDDALAQEQRQTFSALPDKARELNYLASVETVSQAIGKADARNPYELAASASDAPSTQPSPWQLDAGSGAWQRTRYVDLDPSDARMPDRAFPETAGPERAAELDRQASRIIDENIQRGPAALAAQYQIAHKRNGFDLVGQEPMSVKTALNPDTLEASDGKQYARTAQGEWSQGGDPASGIRALELETTRQRLLPALEQHRTQLAAVPEWQPLSPEQQDRANLRQLYADYGVNPNAQRFEAAYQAVQQARVAQGITAETTSLALEPRPAGAYDVDTPIQHLRIEGPGVVRVAATTTAADIARTESALQMAPAATDSPGEQLRIATTAERATQGIAVGASLNDAARDQPNQQRADQAANAARADTPAVDTQPDVSLAMPRTPTAATNPSAATLAQPVSGLSTGPTVAATAQTAPAIDDIRQASHPGNGGYRMLASRVDMFEKQNGIEHGPHSQRLAASLSALSTREQLDPQRLFMQRDEHGAITLVQRTRAGEPESAEVRVPIDAQALGAQPIEVSSRAHAAALSNHYTVMAEHAQRREAQMRDTEARRRDDPRLEGLGIGERSNDAGLMHASANQDGRRTDGTDPRQRDAPDVALAALTPSDRALFNRIRQDVPPTISDAHVAQALLLGKQNHINGAADVERVAVMGDRIVVVGNLHTGAARVDHDASQPAQALEATVQQTQLHNRQQDQNQMLAAQQIQQQSQSGHAR